MHIGLGTARNLLCFARSFPVAQPKNLEVVRSVTFTFADNAPKAAAEAKAGTIQLAQAFRFDDAFWNMRVPRP